MSGTYVAKELREAVSSEARHRCGYCSSQERVVGARSPRTGAEIEMESQILLQPGIV